jgi:hypothetical protein
LLRKLGPGHLIETSGLPLFLQDALKPFHRLRREVLFTSFHIHSRRDVLHHEELPIFE